MKQIIVIGAGGHAKTIVDTIERLKEYEIVGFVDCGEVDREVYRGYRIIGHDEDKERLLGSGICEAVLGIGFMGHSCLRKKLAQEYKERGFRFPVIIDPSAVVAADAMIGEGTYIGRNAVVNAEAHIGAHCIINTAAIVEHECKVEDFSHIAVSAVLCGQARVGENVLIGANATVLQGVTVSEEAIVGAGAVVTKDVPVGVTVVGIPAKVVAE